MILENLLVEMGKAVARDILGSDNKFKELEKELEEVQKIAEDKIDNLEFSKYENLLYLFKFLALHSESKLETNPSDPITFKLTEHEKKELERIIWENINNKKKKSDDEKKKYFEQQQQKLNNGEINAPTLFNYLKSKKDPRLYPTYLQYFFIPKRDDNNKKKKKGKEVSSICHICRIRKGWKKRNFSLFRLSNPTDYKEGGQAEELCNVCKFWLFLSNYYPSIKLKPWLIINKKNYYYKIITNKESITPQILFAVKFSRYIKDQYIRKDHKDYIVFYSKSGGTSKNVSIVTYGKFNITNTLYKMIETKKERGIKRVDKFNRIFINGMIPKYENYFSAYLPLFIEMIQNDMIPTELMRHFLKVFRAKYNDNPKSYSDDLRSFKMFIQDYFKVKNMADEKYVNKGWRIGKTLIDQVKDEEEKGNFQKWVIALSGMMEMSEKEFMKGILQIQRRIRSEIYTKDLEEIAKNSMLRVEFLVGFLSGITSGKKEKTDANQQSNVDVEGGVENE
jgi:hypothetical protein